MLLYNVALPIFVHPWDIGSSYACFFIFSYAVHFNALNINLIIYHNILQTNSCHDTLNDITEF